MNPKLRPNTAHAASLALTATLMLLSPETRAAALGEPVAVSELGQPLHVELPLLGGSLASAGECFRLVSDKSGDGVPWVQNGRLAVVTRGNAGHLVITHPAPVFEPALRLAIEEICESRLRRDYTLLLSFPSADPARVSPSTEATAAVPSRTEPSDAKPPRRQGSRASSGGQEARTPPKTPSRHPLKSGQEAATTPAGSRPGAAMNQDRLVLGGGLGEPGGPDLRLSRQLDSLNRLGKISDQEREQLRREQAVLMEIDRTIVAQLELNDRIRRLEEAQANMMAREQAPDAIPATPLAPPPTSTQTTTGTSSWILPAFALTGLSAALAAGLLWMRRRSSAQGSEFDMGDEREVEPYIAHAPQRPDTPQQDLPPIHQPDVDLTEDIPREPERAPLGWEMASSVSDPLPASGTVAPILPIETTDETAEEHESAIELAEIMMGFGRIQGAAETLAEFIASNPKRAVTPWLKLLEVYRAADLRQEFDALAQQLNKTFNVKAVTWDTFEEARQARHSMEQMGHISSKVQQIWGTEECQAYLEKLLRDNRDGKREGFPLSVIDEILVLAGVLEDELGPYRPQTTDVENSDQWESGGQSTQDAA